MSPERQPSPGRSAPGGSVPLRRIPQSGTGSSHRERQRSGEAYLAIARVVALHGVGGEVRAQLLTDFPERFRHTGRVCLGEERRPVVLQRARVDRKGVLLKVEDVDTREAAERLIGLVVYVPESEAVTLPTDWYFWHQIVGLRVKSVDGVELGQVVQILRTGSNDVYVVHGEGKEILLPATKDVIRSIDLTQGVMTVELVEGLV